MMNSQRNSSLRNTGPSFFTLFLFLLIALSFPVSSQAADALSMNKLLQQVKEGQAKDAADNKNREQAFIAEKAQQVARIKQAMDKLNHRPRKILGFRTPYEVFFNTKTSLTVALTS